MTGCWSWCAPVSKAELICAPFPLHPRLPTPALHNHTLALTEHFSSLTIWLMKRLPWYSFKSTFFWLRTNLNILRCLLAFCAAVCSVLQLAPSASQPRQCALRRLSGSECWTVNPRSSSQHWGWAPTWSRDRPADGDNDDVIRGKAVNYSGKYPDWFLCSGHSFGHCFRSYISFRLCREGQTKSIVKISSHPLCSLMLSTLLLLTL